MTQPNQFLYSPPGGPSIGPGEGNPLSAVNASNAPTTPALDNDQQNAYAMLTDLLRQWNLESLAPDVLKFLQGGYTQTQIPMLLQDTEAYKARFAGNQQRRQKGLAVLSPGEYLQTERSYRQIMANAGLPEGFYDSPQDFSGWIGGDVSPVEVQRRVDEGVDAYLRWDPASKAAAQDLFPEISQDGWLAWILDPQRGRDQLNRQVHGARIAGAARGAGVDLTRGQAEQFGAESTQDYVKQATDFGTLAAAGVRLSGFHPDQQYGVEQAGQEVFQSSTEAARKRQQLFAREEADFGGAGGAGRNALGTVFGSSY